MNKQREIGIVNAIILFVMTAGLMFGAYFAIIDTQPILFAISLTASFVAGALLIASILLRQAKNIWLLVSYLFICAGFAAFTISALLPIINETNSNAYIQSRLFIVATCSALIGCCLIYFAHYQSGRS